MLVPFSIRKYRVTDFLYKSSVRHDHVPDASRGIYSFNLTRDFTAEFIEFSEISKINYDNYDKDKISLRVIISASYCDFHTIFKPYTEILGNTGFMRETGFIYGKRVFNCTTELSSPFANIPRKRRYVASVN